MGLLASLCPEPAKPLGLEVKKALHQKLRDSDGLNLVRVPRISIHNTFNQVNSRKVESASFWPPHIESWSLFPEKNKTISLPNMQLSPNSCQALAVLEA